jgi:hypothetical protein
MKEFKIPERLAQLDEVMRYDSRLKELGKAGHFSVLERMVINQERGQLWAGKENYCHSIALREKIEFVINKINNLNKES